MSSTRLPGIDVSKWQGSVDWQRVKQAGQVFAFARASYGSAEVDSEFAANWRGMKDAGLVRGTYHFFVTAEDAAAQANLFLRALGTLEDGDLPPVLDVEAQSGTGANLVSGVRTWLEVVGQRLGRKPMIYTPPSFWNEHLTGEFGSYPLWVAEYGVRAPRPVNGWGTSWTFWQYSQSGSVAGVAGSVDLDYFNGTPADLAALTNAPRGDAAAVGSPPAETPAPASTAAPTPAPTSPPAAAPAPQTYTVRPGDTLSIIAERHGTTVDAIARANNIENPNLLDAGQVLTIP